MRGRVECFRGRIDVGRVHPLRRRASLRLRRRKRLAHRIVYLSFDADQDRREVGLGGVFVRDEVAGESLDRIAGNFVFTFPRRFVQRFVIRVRMRVRARDMRVHDGRTLAGAHVGDSLAHRSCAGDEVGAVD